MRIAVGAVYQTLTFSRSSIRYQRSASNSASSTIIVTPFVSGAMMPYDVPVTQPGSAVHQIDVVLVQVEGDASRPVVCDHGLVHMHGALRTTRGAAREVQEGHVLGPGGDHVEMVGRHLHQMVEAFDAFDVLHVLDDQDGLQRTEMLTDGRDLASVKRTRRHEDSRLADFHARADRLRSERREQGTEDAPRLQRAERGDVEFRDPAEQRIDALTPVHPKNFEDMREAIGRAREIDVGVVVPALVPGDPAQGDFRSVSRRDMPVEGLEGDVQPAVREPVEQCPGLVPAEPGHRRRVVGHVRPGCGGCFLSDHVRRHRRVPSMHRARELGVQSITACRSLT